MRGFFFIQPQFKIIQRDLDVIRGYLFETYGEEATIEYERGKGYALKKQNALSVDAGRSNAFN